MPKARGSPRKRFHDRRERICPATAAVGGPPQARGREAWDRGPHVHNEDYAFRERHTVTHCQGNVQRRGYRKLYPFGAGRIDWVCSAGCGSRTPYVHDSAAPSWTLKHAAVPQRLTHDRC